MSRSNYQNITSEMFSGSLDIFKVVSKLQVQKVTSIKRNNFGCVSYDIFV